MPAYEADKSSFARLDTQVLGVSVDPVPALKAWADSLGGISYPLLSDFWPHGEVAQRYGVLRAEGYAERAIFVIDREGVVRYADVHDIEAQPDNQVVLGELRRLEPELARASDEASRVARAGLPHGGVVMYCMPGCTDCQAAREWLSRNAIPFREVDLTDVPGATEQVRAWTGGRVITPTFDIDGGVVVDFDEERLAGLLGVGSSRG